MKSSSIEVVFYQGCLPLGSSSIEVVFNCGFLPVLAIFGDLEKFRFFLSGIFFGGGGELWQETWQGLRLGMGVSF